MHKPLQRWSQLRSTELGDSAVEIPTLDSGIDSGFGVARFAIGLNGEPRLLVPISGYLAGGLASTNNLAVSISALMVKGKSVRFIDIMCLEKALNSVFAELAESILRRLEDGDSPHTAVMSAIQDFRELLREAPAPTVPDSMILGLVGELLVLDKLVKINPHAVEAWMGPLGECHDFRRSVHALEVKTSARLDTTVISVHGVFQLGPPDHGTLTLAHVNLQQTAGGECSVASLTQLLQANGVNLETLRERMTAIGCPDPGASEWNRLTYSAPVISTYGVAGEFPCITPATFPSKALPAGVSNLQYAVDLSQATRFLLEAADELVALGRIAG